MGLFSLAKRRLWGDLILVFQYLMGAYQRDGDRDLSRACSPREKGQWFEARRGKIETRHKDSRCFFMLRVAKHCNRLPREVMDAPSLETF